MGDVLVGFPVSSNPPDWSFWAMWFQATSWNHLLFSHFFLSLSLPPFLSFNNVMDKTDLIPLRFPKYIFFPVLIFDFFFR